MSKGRRQELRVGHPERDRAITLLGEHLSAGRLDVAEFDHRCERVVAAQYGSDLRALFDDLPEPRPAEPAQPSKSPRSGELVVGVCLVAMVLVLAVVAKQTWLLVVLALGGVLWFTRRRG